MEYVQVRFCKKSDRKGSRYPFPAKNGSTAFPMFSIPRGEARQDRGREIESLGTGFPERKGKLESGLSDNDAQLPSAREGDQPRIRAGRSMVTARVRTGANRNQESAVRPGDLPRIRTGTGIAGIRSGSLHPDRLQYRPYGLL